jgi:hypothetical protein
MPLYNGECLAQRRRDAERNGLSLTVIKSPSGEPFQGFPSSPFPVVLSLSSPLRESFTEWTRLRGGMGLVSRGGAKKAGA